MGDLYLYADEESQNILHSDVQKVLLIGSDMGNANFGDILQLRNSLTTVQQTKRFSTVVVMAADSISAKDFPAWAREHYRTDAIIFTAEYPLIFDNNSPALKPVYEILNIAAIHLYGGGFLNNMWGDYMLGITEYFLRLAPGATYIVSGQQITPPYHLRVAQHIKNYRPLIFGVRDELSARVLTEAGLEPAFSFDDATELLLSLADELQLQRGDGLLLHLNLSDYTGSQNDRHRLGEDVNRLRTNFRAQVGVSLIQAYRDIRYNVADSRETIKILDSTFPFHDLRLIELAGIAYQNAAKTNTPICGEIGYSCSYHVALWLQLAGIPCWLRSANPFYDQKSRALQITQDLESFLQEPRLADHGANLERRAKWRELLAKFLDGIPDAQSIHNVLAVENGPAPWPFSYKGTPSLEDRLRQANKDRDEWKAKAAMPDVGSATAHLIEMGSKAYNTERERAETAEAALIQAQSQFEHAQAEIAALTAHLDSLITSYSWKFTKPLRAIFRYIRYRYFRAERTFCATRKTKRNDLTKAPCNRGENE